MEPRHRAAARAPGLGLGVGMALAIMVMGPGPGTAALIGSGGGTAPSSPAVADTVEADTVPQDTVRQRILERARERSRGRMEALEEDPEGVDVELARELGEQQARTGGAPPPADSVMEALYGLPGFDVLRYGGESADFHAADGQLYLWGSEDQRARFFGEGMALEADSSIVYDDVGGRMRTVGESTFRPDQGDPVDSRVMIYDLTEDRGTALGARTEYTEQATWFVEGDLTSVQRESSYGREVSFTSCELEEPHYHFRTDQFKILPGDLMVARSVRMYFGDVPVAWLPFMAQSLEEGRQSGLLTPRFSTNDVVRTSSDHNRRVDNIGFYWAMSEYSDATLAFQWFSDNYIALDGALQYRWQERFLDGHVNLSRYWRSEGGRDFSLNTRHNWQYDERTRINVNGTYHSSSQLMRETTVRPEDITQTVDSRAGINRRFDWGNVSLNANRQQDLNTDQVRMTLPSANVSLSSRTLFSAPPAQASWYNNMSLSGSANFRRQLQDRPALEDPDDFTFQRADRVDTRAGASGRLGMGSFSVDGSVNFNEVVHQDVPEDAFGEEAAALGPEAPAFARSPGQGPTALQDVAGVGFQDVGEAEVDWSASASYQHRFFGATTLSPRVSVDGRARQVDTLPAAESFVQGPTRVSLGASLQTELYGFFPGPGDFETLRHKITPRVSYSHSPAVDPTPLQEEVFGARESMARRRITLGVNQSFEAKRPTDDEEEEEAAAAGVEGPRGQELRRRETGDVVNILSLRTSAVTYDLVEADETGRFLDGFTTTRLNNTVDSDYLQGLTLRFSHDLFDTGDPDGTDDGAGPRRRFSPHLSNMTFGFSLDHNSSLVQFVERVLGVEDDVEDEEEDETGSQQQPDPGQVPQDPGAAGGPPGAGQQPPGAGAGQAGWSANFDYRLRRPRIGDTDQMLRANLSFSPSANWSARWSTNVDLESGEFIDHSVNLTRDLHRWQATFSFNQTAHGNWSFRFEVQLMDNRDLEFDFEQRDLGRDGRFPAAGGEGSPF